MFTMSSRKQDFTQLCLKVILIFYILFFLSFIFCLATQENLGHEKTWDMKKLGTWKKNFEKNLGHEKKTLKKTWDMKKKTLKKTCDWKKNLGHGGIGTFGGGRV